jgi:hypothetical protein
MRHTTPEVRLPSTPRTPTVRIAGLRALAALATLSCTAMAVAAPLSAASDRARDGERTARTAPLDFAGLPSVVGTEYLRNGFDNTGHRAIFVMRPVNLPDLIRIPEEIQTAQATSLAPEEVWVGDVVVAGAELRKPAHDLERFYDETLRAAPPPGPNDPVRVSFLGSPGNREVERSDKTLNEYLTAPEPASFVLLCAGGAAVVLRRRRMSAAW